MSDATAATQEMHAVPGTIPAPPPSEPPERESLVRFAPGSKVHTIEQDAAALDAEERASQAPGVTPTRKSEERQAWELIAERLAQLHESNRQVVATVERCDARVKSQAEVTAHIANEVTCIRMSEHSRETNELEGVVVLLVDDDPDVLNSVRRLLHNMKATVFWAESELDARARLLKIGNGKLDCAIVDIVLGDGIGTDLARHIRRGQPDCGIVFVSGYGMQQYQEEGENLGAQLLQKPFSVETIRDAVLEAATRDL